VLEGILSRPLEYSWDRTKLYLNLTVIHSRDHSIPVTGKFLLTIKDCPIKLYSGDRIRFLSKVRSPSNFGNPGCFDYVGYLAREGIYATGFLPDTKYLAKMGGERSYLQSIGRIRDTIREAFSKNLESPSRGIVLAMILGEKGENSPTLREEFVIAGVAHLLAISGLHVGIVAAVAYLMIRWMLKRSYRLALLVSIHKWASFLAIFPVLFYALLSGWNLPTQRAVIMVIAYLVAMIMGRERELMNTLCLAAFIILLFSPTSLFDISFQLSFVSVFFLIYLIPQIAQFLPEEESIAKLRYQWEIKIFRWLRESTFATVAATLGTLPLVALYFNRTSIIGIPANLILIPILGFVSVPLGLLVAILSLISPTIALPFLRLDGQIVDGAIILLRFFAHLPFSDVRVSTPSLLEIFLFYVVLFLLSNVKRSQKIRYSLICAVIVVIADLIFYQYKDRFNPDLRITFLDGGQGDVALVEFPHGSKMLIDGGGFHEVDIDVGERAIAPFLWKKKITKLDYIVLTHPHPDHLNGLPFIARNFSAGSFWWNGDEPLPPLDKKLHEVIGSVRGNAQVVNRTTPPLTINGIRIDFFHPPQRSPWIGNNNSLVFTIRFGEVSFLFTGDIEKEAEADIIHVRGYLKGTVIKVPHHGSLSSSSEEFIRAVNPKVAVFTGKLGRFLPHLSIIQRYRETGVQTIRIDQRGAISFVTNGRSLWLEELKSGIMKTVVP
jgi:competence protein ComEC